jgi:hypothetical protein
MFYILNIIKFTIDKIIKNLNYLYEVYTRLFLRNNIDPEIIDFIKDGQKKYNKNHLIINDVNNVKILKKNKNLKIFIIEVFLIDKSSQNFNVKEKLYILRGYKINNINYIKSFDLKNSDDLGEIVPENTNKYFL